VSPVVDFVLEKNIVIFIGNKCNFS